MFRSNKKEEESVNLTEQETQKVDYPVGEPPIKPKSYLFNPFKEFHILNDQYDGVNIVEVSLKQGQILIIFEKGIIPLFVLEAFDRRVRLTPEEADLNEYRLGEYSSVSFIGDNPALIINTNKCRAQGFILSSTFQNLVDTIEYAAEHVCQCPALEIVFSGEYIKCYLDKPGLTTQDVIQYENMFGKEGTLELFGQRPYLLIINDDFEG